MPDLTPYEQRDTHLVINEEIPSLANISINELLRAIQTHLRNELQSDTLFATVAMFPVDVSGLPDVAMPGLFFDWYGCEFAPIGEQQGTNQLNTTLLFQAVLVVGAAHQSPRPDLYLRQLALNTNVVLHEARRFGVDAIQPARLTDSTGLPEFTGGEGTGNFIAWLIEWEHDVLLGAGDILLDTDSMIPDEVFAGLDLILFYESIAGTDNRGATVTFNRGEPEFAFGTDTNSNHFIVFSTEIDQRMQYALRTLKENDKITFQTIAGVSIATVTVSATDWDAGTRSLPIDTIPSGLVDTRRYRFVVTRADGSSLRPSGDITIQEQVITERTEEV